MDVKKARTSAIAVVAAAAIALSGTFAWQSISQTALNEAKGANPGGRLHDDFSGYTAADTKDIYVENFASQAIYARIRLDEYMEIGTGAGEADSDDKQATSLVSGAEIGDPTTWTTHIPSSTDVAEPDDETADPFHEYWTWNMGGQTVYMPTFNKNQDSLAADINGTLDGTTENDDIYYDDYYKYSEGETADGVRDQTVQRGEFWDCDVEDNDADEGGVYGNGGTENLNFKVVANTHTATETLSATVITMADYMAKSDTEKQTFVGWVYDTDGWAYWSQPIEPGTATGLLLDNITLSNTPTDEWYYAINAVAQFITADDLGLRDGTGFYTDADEAPSGDALTLLAAIGVKTDVAAVMTDANGNIVTDQTLSLAAGATKTLSVTNIAITAATTYEAESTATWNWTSDNEDVVTLSATTGETVTATVADNATIDSTATITVTNENDTDQTATVKIQVVDPNALPHVVTVKAEDKADTIITGDTLQYTATVTAGGSPVSNPTVNWSVTDSAGNDVTGAGISNDGLLSVDANVNDGTVLTVKAETTVNGVPVSGTATVTVKAADYQVTVTAADNATTVAQGGTLTFTASATKDGTEVSGATFTWSANDASNEAIDGVLISDGTLSVDTSVTAGTSITVTATTTLAGKEFSGTATVRVLDVGSVVTLDGIEFVVMATNVNGDSDHILLLSRYILEERGFDEQNHSSIGAGGNDTYGDNVWSESRLRTYLNSDAASGVTVVKGTDNSTTTVAGWLYGKTAIQKAAVETTIYTTTEWNDATLRSTTDKIFLLSQADVFGTYGLNNTDTAVDDTKMYTVGEKLALNDTVNNWIAYHPDDLNTADYWWLRSPRSTNSSNCTVAIVYLNGLLGGGTPNNVYMGVRPAFVASISKLPTE